MKIKAIKLYKDGYMTKPFAMGGEDGMDKFNPETWYRSSLQNFLIDTGDEVILVDTGLPKEVPEAVPDEKTMIHMGSKIESYEEAFKKEGYSPEQVTKILITHKHADHTGELRLFPNADIIIGEEDLGELDMPVENARKAEFADGPYKNFPESMKIAEGVYLIKAKGHTKGNCIIIAEDEGTYFMMHGDVTYTDEALYENKLSVVFEDLAEARTTLDRVREFIRNNPTVYLSTHTPLGYENLENRTIVDLDRPPKTIPVTHVGGGKETGKYVCSVCGYIYDPELGDEIHSIPAGTSFENLPDFWVCPRCKQGKDKFNKA